MIFKNTRVFAYILLVCFSTITAANTTRPNVEQQLARDIYKQFIEIHSGFTTGATTPLVEAAAKRLREAGFSQDDVFIGGANPNKANLVVRYHGSGEQKPILLLAHVDVVEANASDWSMNPFTLNEKGGYFYGRGSVDDKAQAALWIANLIQFKKEGFKPRRDIIVALTADEEGYSPYNGVRWLLKNHKELIQADFAINEGGWGDMVDGKKISQNVQVAEKYILNFRLDVHNQGGHSSLPTQDNAIYRLTHALSRLFEWQFPLQTNEITASYFKQMAAIETEPLKTDLLEAANNSKQAMARIANRSSQWNAMLRTTCTPTLLKGGHAMNALPQLASVFINCRVLPEDSPEMVEKTIQKVINDSRVSITRINKIERSPISSIQPQIFNTVTQLTHQFWPNVRTIPIMVMGATDGRFLRKAGIPTYGIMGIFLERNDIRAHGKDERISVKTFYEGQAFLYDLVKKLANC